MTRPTDDASLISLRAEFMLDANVARLLALNSVLEAARLGSKGEPAAKAAHRADSAIIDAMASNGEAVSLLARTLEKCRVPTGSARSQVARER